MTREHQAASLPFPRFAREVAAACPVSTCDLARTVEALALSEPTQRFQSLARWPGPGPAVVLELLHLSWLERSGEPREARKWAELAVQLADSLPGGRAALPLLADCRAAAWSVLGNAYRLEESYLSAGRALVRAERHRRQGSKALELAARLRGFEASLRRDGRDFEAAAALARRATQLFQQAGMPEQAAQQRLKLVTIYRQMGSPLAALDCLAEAGEALVLGEEPRTALDFAHNSAVLFSELGQPELGLQVLSWTHRFYARFAGELLLLRGRWLLGVLNRQLGHWRRAEELLGGVKEAFLQRGLAYDASLAGLDLALTYAEQGKSWQVRLLAEALYEVFAAKGIPREAAAALLLFAEAAREERVDVNYLTSLLKQLKRLTPSKAQAG